MDSRGDKRVIPIRKTPHVYIKSTVFISPRFSVNDTTVLHFAITLFCGSCRARGKIFLLIFNPEISQVFVLDDVCFIIILKELSYYLLYDLMYICYFKRIIIKINIIC